jgi:hypothetical protein
MGLFCEHEDGRAGGLMGRKCGNPPPNAKRAKLAQIRGMRMILLRDGDKHLTTGDKFAKRARN